MSSTSDVSVLDEARKILLAADLEGNLVPCGIRQIRIGRGEIERVADLLLELLAVMPSGSRPAGTSPSVVLLVDTTPIHRLGKDLKAAVQAQLAKRFTVRTVVLDDGASDVHVEEHVVDTATRAAIGADAVVALGGGTITDIAKLALSGSVRTPLVFVQTSASVDGFTDNVSVILRNGVKRTVPSRWPDVVIADMETIAEAPAPMNRGGYGEMTSMFTAPADWRLSSILDIDRSFHRGPTELLTAAGQGIESWSDGVGRADPDALQSLVRALAIRGIATGVAGTTACLSGVEHLVSHMLDIYHGAQGLPIGLHGAQVGVGSLIAAAAWELLFQRLDEGGAAHVDVQARLPDLPALEATVEAAFAWLDPTGAVGAECWRDYSAKVTSWLANQEMVTRLLAGWPRHRSEFGMLMRPAEEIGAGLRAAGTAARFSELDPIISPDLARWAVTNCALMRNRFTVVDLLTFFGWWGYDEIGWVLTRAEGVGTPRQGAAL